MTEAARTPLREVPGDAADGYLPEWRVLSAIAAFDDRYDDPRPVLDALTGDLAYGQLVLMALRHTLMPAVADFLIRHGTVPRALGRGMGTLVGSLHWNRARCAAMTAEAVRVVAALARAGVRGACTKGSSLQYRLHDGRGTRYFSDIDIMIDPVSRETSTTVLTDLGYQPQSGYSYRRDEIVPISRARGLIYRINPDHLPPFHRLSGDPAIPFFAVDVANSLTWWGSTWEIPVTDALRTLQTVPPAPGAANGITAMTPPYEFLTVALHLFREAWFQRTARTKDVRLSQFADVFRYWRRYREELVAAVPHLVRQHALGPPMAWVAAHTDAVFGSSIVEGLGLAGHTDAHWLRTTMTSSGTVCRWHGDMARRMREPELVLEPADEGR